MFFTPQKNLELATLQRELQNLGSNNAQSATMTGKRRRRNAGIHRRKRRRKVEIRYPDI